MDQQILDYFEGFEENTRIVPLKYFFFESEAHLYAARLKEAGIPCFISNANIMTVLPLGGGGGIGLHIREADLPEASRIAARLDYQKNHDNPDASFHDASHDDIEYQRALNAPPMQVGASPAWYWLVVGIILLVILRAFLRAAGVVESWRDFF
ncbi:MAG: DUF2007 domain-containing protein [Lewinellaceae bacterium]|nr:DUF2007 domain-containing protein [Phaeodactylibacter sp.]MCB0616375.1 DUF2007 domain-containing protein [Phaeodactylibacter sp.]MCB9347309.1 DUF2007 domain-containing protein [Lewinellaceae bacterium]